jgi:hypothetical protein
VITEERKEVIDMDGTRKLNPQALLALLAMAFVVAAIWAATALAGGASSSSSDSAGGQPAAEFVQSDEDGETPSATDCPDKGSGSDSSEPSSTDF